MQQINGPTAVNSDTPTSNAHFIHYLCKSSSFGTWLKCQIVVKSEERQRSMVWVLERMFSLVWVDVNKRSGTFWILLPLLLPPLAASVSETHGNHLIAWKICQPCNGQYNVSAERNEWRKNGVNCGRKSANTQSMEARERSSDKP